jgi:hypothetical protein
MPEPLNSQVRCKQGALPIRVRDRELEGAFIEKEVKGIGYFLLDQHTAGNQKFLPLSYECGRRDNILLGV